MQNRTMGLVLVIAAALAGCSGDVSTSGGREAQSCMVCHNGSPQHDYAGPGLENPHPFPGADNLLCTACHGGDGTQDEQERAHVPPPPELGDRAHQDQNAEAWFNRLTLAGVDKYPDYEVNGRAYTALDYLQFINPGDLRVVTEGKSCGACHGGHAECVAGGMLATSTGIFSGALYAAGAANRVPEQQGLYEDTAADMGVRAVTRAAFGLALAPFGGVGQLVEFPVFSQRTATGPDAVRNNPEYDAAALVDDIGGDGRVVSGSPLANLYHEMVALTCGDCHLGSAGANNRYGDFRSSGCTACHMPYSLDGRSRSRDPLVNKTEPVNPDAIDDPERAHVRAHRIVSVAKTLANGVEVQGIDDATCAGCHQGSNRTVMQYWGIRLDQNQDVRRGNQYPAQPASFLRSFGDTRLFDPEVGNNTFNGRNGNQYLVREDYDGDGRDDTPADVHYEAGMGCIDCHGSHDLHGGDVAAGAAHLESRMEQAVAIRCESCHGSADAYADVVAGTTYDGTSAEVAFDAEGLPLRHVHRDAQGNFWLKSRLTGAVHYVPQTRDTVVNSGRTHPVTGATLYSAKASYAMGRVDGDTGTGLGPIQTSGAHQGFSHMDNMDCASCHSSWTNTCMGCHLEGEYDNGNNFSNITGERIVFKQKFAEFVYQSPVFFQLGVDASNKITQTSANTKVFFRWEDRNNNRSQVFTFSDRNGGGASPFAQFPSMSHNAFMAHSIRGRVDAENEGPRYCVACHLTTDAVANYGAEYDAFRAALESGDFGALDYPLLKQHIGQNPGNQLNSPFFVHQVAGLGSGLFLFDSNGAAVNPLDQNANRYGTDGVAPATNFDPGRVTLNLDRVVEPNGVSNGSSNHALLDPTTGPNLRDGALDPAMAGPLGATLLRKLTDPQHGLVLDSWIDADGAAGGDAATHLAGQ
ncbi:MAG: hypothetical protein R3F49_16160 [Planctomycetota bacterium]